MLGFPSVSNLIFAQENSYYAELSGGQDLSNLISVSGYCDVKIAIADICLPSVPQGRFEQTT